MAEAVRDQNFVTSVLLESSTNPGVTLTAKGDQITGRLLVDNASASGTVTSVSVVSANGFAGSVATATTTPAITISTTITGILKGNGTAISAATDGTDYLSSTTGITVSQSTPQTLGSTGSRLTKLWATDITVTNAISGSITGNAATVTTNANLTGPITSVGNATSIASQTGTGTKFVVDTSPTLVTPILGVATATSINGLTITTSTGVITITNGKTLAVTNSLTLTGTDSTVMTFPTTSAAIARTDAGQTFTGVQVMTSPSITTANLTGTQLFAENASIGLDPSLSADGTWSGITMTATSGYTQAFGDLVYLDPTDSRWEAVDANSAAGADGDARGILGMVVIPGNDGNSCTILLQGNIRADANFPSFTINNPIYVSETAGDVTQTQPSTTDVVIRVVGFALTADSMYFNPSSDYITHI